MLLKIFGAKGFNLSFNSVFSNSPISTDINWLSLTLRHSFVPGIKMQSNSSHFTTSSH